MTDGLDHDSKSAAVSNLPEGVGVRDVQGWLLQYVGEELDHEGHVAYWCGMLCCRLMRQYKAAVAWYRMAADNHNADAEYGLGIM